MRVKYKDSIEYKTLTRIKAIYGNIVLRKDFNDIGSYRQISRVLNKLIKAKKLVKISMGIYAKAYASKYTDGAFIKNGADSPTLREALTCLAKAHRLVKHMSEDVDFKIQIKNPQMFSSKN